MVITSQEEVPIKFLEETQEEIAPVQKKWIRLTRLLVKGNKKSLAAKDIPITATRTELSKMRLRDEHGFIETPLGLTACGMIFFLLYI